MRKKAKKDHFLATTNAEVMAWREAETNLISKGVLAPRNSSQDAAALKRMMNILRQAKSEK